MHLSRAEGRPNEVLKPAPSDSTYTRWLLPTAPERAIPASLPVSFAGCARTSHLSWTWQEVLSELLAWPGLVRMALNGHDHTGVLLSLQKPRTSAVLQRVGVLQCLLPVVPVVCMQPHIVVAAHPSREGATSKFAVSC